MKKYSGSYIYDNRNIMSSTNYTKYFNDIIDSMKKKTTIKEFGKRLAYYRKLKGLTQKELGEQVGVANRVIAYYEGETNYPPAHLIVPLSKALSISTDELLGVKETKNNGKDPNLRILRRLNKIEALPPSEQKFLLKTIDTLLKASGKK
jgi:transcriptional regulator with XRE-family HTH domain